MVIRIEPLLHGKCFYIALFALVATGRREVSPKRRELELLISLRDDAEQERRIEHIIVEGKIVGTDEVHSCIFLCNNVTFPDIPGSFRKCALLDLTSEELLRSELQLSFSSDPRVTNN